MDFTQAVRLPQFTTFVADNLRDPSTATSALIVGSPLYLDEKESSFSMIDGCFPSDAHLRAPRENSVYSTEGRIGALDEVTVSISWFGDPWTSEIQEKKIRRFWSLYLREQGAGLANFNGDLATAFGTLGSIMSPQNRYEIDPEQSRIEMLRISREVGVSDWILRDLSIEAAPPPPATTTGPMKIAIRWSGEIDLDLYARPSPDSATLSFQNERSDVGSYFKDHRSSPDREYEFIEFLEPIDCLAAEAWVNFFEGAANAPTSGDVRIEFDGRIYARPFTRGNQGRGGADQSAYWARIDIAEVLSLP